MPRIDSLAISVCLVGCAATPSPSSSSAPAIVATTPHPIPAVVPAPSPPTTVRARLTHTAADTWVVDYAFSAPVEAIAFERERIVRDAWRILEPSDATRSGVFITAPHAFSTLRFELKTDTVQPEAEYAPFCRFTDRGFLVYTGQLNVAHATCDSGACSGAHGLSVGVDFGGAITLVADASAHEHVVVAGASPLAEATLDATDDGTYAYFGDLTPIETDDVTGTYDRALPEWLGRWIVPEIPRMLAFYRTKLGPLEGRKTTAFVSFAARSRGRELSGGTLDPYVLNIDVGLGPDQLVDARPEIVADLVRNRCPRSRAPLERSPIPAQLRSGFPMDARGDGGRARPTRAA